MLELSKKITAYHPNGKDFIIFDEGPHTYTDNSGKIYESGTRFTGKYFNKFDAVKIADMCSKGDNPKYKGRSSEEIQMEWSVNGEIASQEGTNIHHYGECSFLLQNPPKPISERCSLIFKQVDKVVAELNQYYQFIGAEVIVFSRYIGKAGSVDLVMWSKKSNEIVIFDFKTNKKVERYNDFQKALPPINHLEETEIAKYSLQLSFYQYVIERENYFPGVAGYKRALIHLWEDGFEIIPLEDYSFEIKEMLKYEGFENV